MELVGLLILCCLFEAVTAENDYEVSGPFYAQSSRNPKRLAGRPATVVYHSWMDDPFIAVEDSVKSGVHVVEDYAESGISKVETEIGSAVNSTEQFIGSTVTTATSSMKGALSKVGHKLQGAANQTKYFVIQSTKSAKGFFTSAFESATNWFTKIEAEVKQLLHFILKVVEVAIALIILGLFIWILKRVTAGYRFVKGVAESFELHDRSSGIQTV